MMAYKDANDVLQEPDSQAADKKKRQTKPTTVKTRFEMMKSVRDRLESSGKPASKPNSSRPRIKRETVPSLFK